jgi:hypothetical protein
MINMSLKVHNHTAPDACHSHSCHPKKNKSTFDKVMNIAEKISAVALGIFAASVSFKLFLPFFFVGVGIGAYNYAQNKHSHNNASGVSPCAQGFLEGLTGVKLPAPVSLATNIAVTVCHIDHHGSVFVPIVGISVGAWAGKNAFHYGSIACKKINAVLVNKPVTFENRLSFA